MRMIIKEREFLLGIVPSMEVCMDAQYKLTLDGRPASRSEIRGEWDRAKKKVWRRSDRLYDQAAFFGANEQGIENQEMAEKLLNNANEWRQAEDKVVADEMKPRVGGGLNFDFLKTPPWKEFNKIEDLGKKGEKLVVMDYPIVAVSLIGVDWGITLGEGKRGDVAQSWTFAQWAVDAAKEMLSLRQFKVERNCAPINIDQCSRPTLRVDWSFCFKGLREWKGRKFFGVGNIMEW